MDDENVTVIVTGYEEDPLCGYEMKLYLENKTNRSLMFKVYQASANTISADNFYETPVSAGKCAFGSVFWSDYTLEVHNVTQVENIKFTLRVYDEWTGDDFVNEDITLNP